jgi:hypothetical protein
MRSTCSFDASQMFRRRPPAKDGRTSQRRVADPCKSYRYSPVFATFSELWFGLANHVRIPRRCAHHTGKEKSADEDAHADAGGETIRRARGS